MKKVKIEITNKSEKRKGNSREAINNRHFAENARSPGRLVAAVKIGLKKYEAEIIPAIEGDTNKCAMVLWGDHKIAKILGAWNFNYKTTDKALAGLEKQALRLAGAL